MASEDLWSIATAQDGDKPLILRIRNQAPSFAQKLTFPHLMAVSWQYDSPNDMGMPSADVTEGMGQFEDLVDTALENAHQAFLSLIITGNGFRQWHWYARDPQATMDLVNKALAECDLLPIEITFQEDPEWGAYSPFLEIPGA
jgi:hypothetical protein